MEFFRDPILIVLLILASASAFIALRPGRRTEFWFLSLLLLLFGLPRAGIVVQQVQLPLPLAHILCAVLVIEWLFFRRSRSKEGFRFGKFFLLYAVIAGFGLVVGLSAGGGHIVAFLELCFYLFTIGIFFYVVDTFREQKHFLTFARVVLVISVLVSIYGIAQRYLGSSILVPHLTYNTGGGTISRQYIEVTQASQIRVLSSYGDPNVLASQLIVFIGIALALVVGRGVKGNTRLLCLGVLVINVVCLYFTRSRAGLISMFLVILVVMCWRTRWALLLIPVLALAGYFMIPALVSSYMDAQFQGVITGEEIRLLFPRMAWQLLNIVPLGCGFGRTVFLNLEGLNWTFSVAPTTVVWAGLNSFWLNLMCRLGVPGVLAFLLLLIVLFRFVWTRAKQVENRMVRAVLIGALAGFVGQWIIWLVNNTYMLPGGGLNFWFTMGMLVAGCRAFMPPRTMVVLPEGQLIPVDALGRMQPGLT
jgi:O-antigen ligase/polysaccharide polymerase Wzy-like membrane protein